MNETPIKRLLCEIFKSPRRDEMYLYVDKRRGLVDLPEALRERFGPPQSVMTLLLTPDTRLSRAQSAEVIDIIESQGFYLQMPPAREAYLLDMYRAPTEARY